MADPFDLLAQYAGINPIQAKQGEVDTASKYKRDRLNSMGPSQEYYDAAVARRTGQGLLGVDERTRDMRTMGAYDLIAKYGATGGAMNRGLVQSAEQYSNDRTMPRTGLEIADDSVADVIRAAVNGPVGIAALATGLVNDDAGAAVSNFQRDWNDEVDSQQTRALNARRRATQTESRLAGDDNRYLMEQEKAAGDAPLLAEARRIGRDIMDTGWIYGSNPDMLLSGGAQGVGSLLSGGAVGGLVKGGAKGILGKLGVDKSAMIAEKTAMPLTIMAQESGSVYAETVNEVMAMSFDELMETSPEYRRLVGSGIPPEEARVQLAGRAGKIAAVVTAPTALAAGKMVAGFEAKPFAVQGLREIGKNILKEGLEEGVQSGSGQFASNLGQQQTVNPNKDMGAGIGDQIAQGAMYGSLSAGMTQAPGASGRLALTTVRKGSKFIANTVMDTVDAALGRGDKIVEDTQKQSPVSAENLESAAANAATNAPAMQEAVREIVTDEPAIQYVDKLVQAATVVEDDAAASQLEVLRETLAGSTDKFNVLSRLADVTVDENRSEQDRLTASVYLLNQLRSFQGIIEDELPTALHEIPADHPVKAQLDQMESVIVNIQQHPGIVKALKAAAAFEMGVTLDQISEAAVATPEGQQAVYNAVGVAEHLPQKVNPELNDLILQHAKAGRINLTPAQLMSLMSSSALIRAGQKMRALQASLAMDPIDLVSRQIRSDRSDNPDALMPSALDHVANINSAMGQGNIALAKERLQRFVDFAQHMQNKVEAVNESLKTRSNVPVPFQAIDPATFRWFQSNGIYTDLTNRRSVLVAQQVGLDAGFVGQLAQELTQTYKQLGVTPPTLATLSEKLKGPAQSVTNRTIAELRASKKKAAPAPVTKPVVQPVAEQPVPVQEVEAKPETRETPIQAEPEVMVPETKPEAEQPKAPEPKATEAVEVVEAPAKVEEPIVDEIEETVQIETEQDELKRFATLKGGNFQKAFTAPKEPISKLSDTDKPVEAVVEALSSATAFAQAAEGKTGQKLTADLVEAYKDHLRKINPILRKLRARMADELAKPIVPKDPSTPPVLDVLNETGAPGRWKRGKTFNLVQSNNYNTELLQKAALAALSWVVNAEHNGRIMDDEAVSKALNIPVEAVDQMMIAFFNNGISVADAKLALGQKVMAYWGVRPKRNISLSYTRGIPEAMAAELLHGLVEAKLITIEYINVDQPDAGKVVNGKTVPPYKTYTRIMFAKDENKVSVMDGLKAFPTAIDFVALTQPEDIDYIGAPPPSVARSQMRNPLVSNTRQQRQVIEVNQSVVHNVDRPMMDFVAALGRTGVMALFGGGLIDGLALNKNHEATLRGRNLTVVGAFDKMMNMKARLENMDGEITDHAIHYAFNVSRAGRLHMLGRHNPQANKLSREIILPTWSTSDLTDEQNYNRFMLAVAQAVGIKVHKIPRLESISKAKEFLAKPNAAAAVNLLEGWLESGHDLDDQDLQTLNLHNEDGNKIISPVMLHALMEVARFNIAGDAEKRAFKTSLYVEADGVTDGPINALVHMSAGMFTSHWLRSVAKGGLFFGAEGRTMNQHNQEDKIDLYASVKNRLSILFAEKKQALSTSEETTEHMNSLLRVMNHLLPDVSFNEETGTITLDRGIVKNPLTVTIYGSGKKGIADKVVTALLDSLYEELSTVSVRISEDKSSNPAELMFGHLASPNKSAEDYYHEFVADFNALTNREVRVTLKGANLVNAKSRNEFSNFSQDFTVKGDQLAALKENLLQMFVLPLDGAIQDVIHEITPTTRTMQSAIQIQSIFLKHAFLREVQRMLDTRKAEQDGGTEFLSQAELDTVYAKLKHLSPFIETGNMAFLIGGEERSDVPMREWASDLDDNLNTEVSIYGPTNAGVSGTPIMIIGPGDGQMMQNYYTLPGAPKQSLPVFDGLHVPITEIENGSVKINEAVHKAWMENPLWAVNETFSAFMRDTSFEMDKAQIAELAEALLPRKEAPTATKAQVEAQIKAIAADLQRYAEETQARHETMLEYQMTVDHMAAGESSYVSEGEQLDGLSEEQILQKLNNTYAEKLRVIRSQPKPQTDLNETLQALADENGVIAPESLFSLVQGINLPADQKRLLVPLLRSLKGLGYKIVLSPSEGEIQGVTNVGTKTITLYAPKSETLLHELIHAATVEKVFAVVNSDEAVTQEERDAVYRIEALMLEWLGTEADLTELNPEIRLTFTRARGAVEAWLNSTEHSSAQKRTAAINEFMAWNLSNQDLVNLGKRQQINPILRISSDVLKAIKALIFGDKAPFVGKDLYSNLRFNTSILLAGQRTVAQVASNFVLYQSNVYGTNERLSKLDESFFNKIAVYAREVPKKLKPLHEKILATMQTRTSNVLHSLQAHGFSMTPQEYKTAYSMLTTIMADIYIDPSKMRAVQELFTHVTKTLNVEDFMIDPTSTHPSDRYWAQEKFNSLNGMYGIEYDDEGRSTLLPVFMTLAMVNDQFRAVLAKVPMPKSMKLPGQTIDTTLTNLGVEAMERLGDTMSGLKRNSPNVSVAIELLTRGIAETNARDQDLASQAANQASGVLNKTNDWVVDQMQDLAEKTFKAARPLKASNNKLTRVVGQAMQLTAGIVHEDLSSKVAQGLMSMMDQTRVWRPIHEIMNELVGRTPEIASVYDMIKAVRSVVQQMRQQFREEIPEIIAKKFTRELTKEEWTALHLSMARTDLASLRSSYTNVEIISMLGDKAKLSAEVSRLEARIQQNEGVRATALLHKSAELAEYMITGKVPGSLLRNAHAIASLFNEPEQLASGTRPSNQLVNDVDQLVTMYALEKAQGDLITELTQTEKEGLDFTLSYLTGQRLDEQTKLSTEQALNNHYKGYTPSEAQEGAALIVVDDSEFTELRMKGFTRVADYAGSRAERGAISKGYYYSPVAGRTPYNQGIMQNVRPTASGVDPVTGFTYGTISVAGRITDQHKVRMITRLRAQNEKATEALMPIFDEYGSPIAYERSISADQEIRLQHNTHLGEVIGAWRGRQAEEALAVQSNKALIDKLHDMWVQVGERNNRGDEFIDLFDEKKLDPVLRDSVKLFTPEAREYIREKFGENFMVRQSLVNDVVGYRSASVGDLWNGTTRWEEGVAKDVRRLAIAAFGIDAFRYLTQAERIYQNVISAARVLIVVKSVVVPVTNLISNVYQLMARGVPLPAIIKGLPAKTAEVDQYVKNRIRTIELEAELRATNGDVIRTRKAETELKGIRDANSRMTIWPLIKANEFSSISEGGVTREEVALTEGRLGDYMEALVKKLPEQVQTAGRYAIISKDTALFKGLARAVEYGDFLGKAVLYEYLTSSKKLSQEDALAKITEEFINYDRLPGRTRGYLESMGLVWFWNFKLRSVKIAISMIRNNPLNALLAALAPAPPMFGSVGLPIEDNFFSITAEGKLGNSIGLGQGLRSPNLIPWVQMMPG